MIPRNVVRNKIIITQYKEDFFKYSYFLFYEDLLWLNHIFIKTYLKYIPKNNNDILGMDLVTLKESTPYISV